MNYKSILYSIFFILNLFAISGINFDHFMKMNRPMEARIIVIVLAICSSYLVTNFIIDFINA